jgi:hypothetical protein
MFYGMFGGPPAPPAPQYLIHIINGGKTMCGIPSPDLKKNERWVEVRAWDSHLANCDKCTAKVKR